MKINKFTAITSTATLIILFGLGCLYLSYKYNELLKHGQYQKVTNYISKTQEIDKLRKVALLTAKNEKEFNELIINFSMFVGFILLNTALIILFLVKQQNNIETKL